MAQTTIDAMPETAAAEVGTSGLEIEPLHTFTFHTDNEPETRGQTMSTLAYEEKEEAGETSGPQYSQETLDNSGADIEKGAQVGEEERDPNIVDFDGDDDPAKAINWSSKQKWGMIALISIMTLITCEFSSSPTSVHAQEHRLTGRVHHRPLASSMFAPGVPEVLSDFHSDSEVSVDADINSLESKQQPTFRASSLHSAASRIHQAAKSIRQASSR